MNPKFSSILAVLRAVDYLYDGKAKEFDQLKDKLKVALATVDTKRKCNYEVSAFVQEVSNNRLLSDKDMGALLGDLVLATHRQWAFITQIIKAIDSTKMPSGIDPANLLKLKRTLIGSLACLGNKEDCIMAVGAFLDGMGGTGDIAKAKDAIIDKITPLINKYWDEIEIKPRLPHYLISYVVPGEIGFGTDISQCGLSSSGSDRDSPRPRTP